MGQVKSKRLARTADQCEDGVTVMEHIPQPTVELYRDPNSRVALDDLTDEQFFERFAGYRYLLITAGQRTVYAACRTTRAELEAVLARDWPDFREGGNNMFGIGHGPEYLKEALAGSSSERTAR